MITRSASLLSLVLFGLVATGCAVRSTTAGPSSVVSRESCARLGAIGGGRTGELARGAWSHDRLTAQALYDTALVDYQSAASLNRQAAQLINNSSWRRPQLRGVSAYDMCREALRRQRLSSEDVMPLVREL